MCGRFTLTDPDPRMLRLRFDLAGSAKVEAKARYNVAPTDRVLAIRRSREGTREAGQLRWGLIPHYADPGRFDRMLINARAETVASAPAFRDAFAGFRCLIAADGFYEWERTEAGKRPVWITRPDREVFAFAGLWARAVPKDGGEAVNSCTIITCPPAAEVAAVHDRMPVILDRELESRWLDPEAESRELEAMLKPAGGMELTPVSTLVNDVRNDRPEVLQPPDPPLALF